MRQVIHQPELLDQWPQEGQPEMTPEEWEEYEQSLPEIDYGDEERAEHDDAREIEQLLREAQR